MKTRIKKVELKNGEVYYVAQHGNRKTAVEVMTYLIAVGFFIIGLITFGLRTACIGSCIASFMCFIYLKLEWISIEYIQDKSEKHPTLEDAKNKIDDFLKGESEERERKERRRLQKTKQVTYIKYP